MAKKSTSRTGATARPAGKKSKTYETLMGLGLWVLGIFNTVLIVSFLMKHMASGDEQILNVTEPVVSQAVEQVIHFEVKNGCGTPGIAAKFADQLEAAGMKPTDVGNFSNYNMQQTIIFDRKSQNRIHGLKVAELLGLPGQVVAFQAKEEGDVDVTVIIGKDYQNAGFLHTASNR